MKNKTKLIAITGGSGAGKTWLAEKLQRALGTQAARISLDDFYKDLSHLPPTQRAEVNFDEPHAIDWPLFEAAMLGCLAGRTMPLPQYDFTTHTRLPHAGLFSPAPLVLVEGLWLLWSPQVAELFDLKIFLDCPAQLRFERRLARDVTARGRTPDSVGEQFLKTVAPMHDRFVEPQAKWADIILTQPASEADIQEIVEIVQMEMLEALAPETIMPLHGEFSRLAA